MKSRLRKRLSKIVGKDGEEKSFLKDAGSSFLIKVVGAGLAFALNALLGRLLGVEEYGAYTFVFSLVNISVIIVVMGFDKSLLRFIPEYKKKKEWASLKGVLLFSLKAALLISGIYFLIAVGIILVLDTSSMEYGKVLLLMGAAIVPLMGLMMITLNALMGFKKVTASLVPQMIVAHLVIAIVVIIYYLAYQEASAEVAMIGKLLGIGIALTIGLFFLKKTLPEEIYGIKEENLKKYWLRTSLPMLLIAGIYIVLRQTDIIMIGSILGKTDVGVYGAVVKVSALVLFGLQAVNVVTAPKISELYHSNEKKQLQRIITLSSRISFGFSLLASIFFVICGRFVLSIFGPSFVDGYSALMILLVAFLLNCISGSVGYIMVMTGHQDTSVKILGGSAIINVVLNLILIPKWGVEGAAIATGISMNLWTIVMIIYIKKKMDINATIF